MPNNPTKILLSTTLIGGILISISSNSWLGAWMGLEINLMSFIPLMSSQENIFTTEASLKYFIIQALASSVLLFLVVMEVLINQNPMVGKEIHEYVIMTPLLMKMGAAPMHWWFPSVMEGLSWENCLLMMTVQKAAPMMLTSYLMKVDYLILAVVMMSVMVGSAGGMNQTSLRKILTYSSINHTGWMLMALAGGSNLWMMYFAMYSLLTAAVIMTTKMYNISFINQTMSMSGKTATKFVLFTNLLSLGGLPPFIGFLPKWAVIQTMITNNLSSVMTMMVITSLATLYYYLRMCYSSFITLHSEVKWGPVAFKVNKTTTYGVILSSVSMMGLVACTMITNIN
uniref:NADH-ubiquinone oxidoreductase chain 2 n=1 Tax=Cryptotermes havilandi TaxID=641612 RepID=A0A7U3QS35_9NEOP|nr:NADH dehydrogenase subunit 2 [Cryptotermes havilandi]QPN53777.1 NADH dehydrogenase subunit 2 [Cryptotermes havilandi]URX52838.1 NADH dehydrogenase subunit 2 [Cryptotermes havilandi]URX52877.1 NADH dehydrogenase subunit 2 [Cryptotermes havilandi]URX54396.1 NADH dehydrogenase subunit 2 [Cryptotermes havilandi]